MAQHDDGVTTPDSGAASSHGAGSAVVLSNESGTGVVPPDSVTNPGFPPHNPRQTNLDPKKDKNAERQVTFLFFLSIIG
ncbi:MAG TPA: ubiquinol-cytochrome C reductase, partial [Galbitalea sp.]|nr:ubiquinol-cytochrome C reductase [Galbitalea sp.]